jgi:uncharacterized protein (TIGR00369 family)
MTCPPQSDAVDHRHVVADYFRLERWEIESATGSDDLSAIGGRIPVDPLVRGAGGGLRTGVLLGSIDALGGFLCGISVLPDWVVTTSVMTTVARLSHHGPLRLHGRVLRRGRNSVVAAIGVTDEGNHDREVAAATMTCAVLDPGDRRVDVERPFSAPMTPRDPEALPPEEFFGIEPGAGSVTRLRVVDRIRNPWGILHGGALAVLIEAAACRAAEVALSVSSPTGRGHHQVAAADTVLHFLRPVKVGPVEARCEVLGIRDGRTLIRVAVHDAGVGDRMVTLASVEVLAI